jgi:predicted ribosome quality control (RQC) complex YloA/Tae2 family protein
MSVNDAVRRVAAQSRPAKGPAAAKLVLHEKIAAELRKAEKTRASIAADLEEGDRSAHYAMTGKLLMSNLSLLKKGMKAIRLEETQGGAHEITLDPALTPVQNAERFFEKAKKAKVRRGESAERLKSADMAIARLGSLLGGLEASASEDDVREFVKAHEEELRSMKLLAEKPGKEAPPFRIFTVPGGFEVWVGKSSANNDLLTMKYAQPNDLWFHVRGASGSHTVLKVPRGGGPPPREAIRAAASIAVYYSKMRKAGNVPVAYCERKYVRKPKGANAGAVVLEREEVIFVQPKLPG